MSMRPVSFLRAAVLLAFPLPFWVSPISGQDNEFDIDIARVGVGGRFEPFRVTETEPLLDAISANKLQGDTRVLVMDHPAGLLAFLADQMVYHHVAQGETNGEPWMVSF